MRQKIFFGLVLLLGLGGMIYGYIVSSPSKPAPAENTEGFPLRIIDSYQREITLKRRPARVVSVAPNITEIIFALGKGGALVGRTEYCDYPPEALKVACVGNVTDPSIETIVRLKPDLVIASTHFQKTVLEKLEDLGIKVAVFYGPADFDGVYTTIRQVGKALGAREEAESIVAGMRRKINRIGALVRNAPKPKVYYVVDFGPAGDFTAGKDTFIGKMITKAGGINVAEDTRGWQYSLEKLVAKNPDLLICSRYHQTKARLQQAVGYRELPAVRAGKIFEIDSNLLDRQGPRLAEGLEELARILHPELLGNSSK